MDNDKSPTPPEPTSSPDSPTSNNNELLANTLQHEIDIHFWSIDSLSSKSKSALAAGSFALSVMIAGLVGFINLLHQNDHEYFITLVSLFGDYAALALCCAIAGLLAILASITLSVISLRQRPVYQILNSADFEVKAGKTDPATLKEFSTKRQDWLYMQIFDSYIRVLRSLEEYNTYITKFVTVGQWALLFGLAAGSIPILIVLFGLINSYLSS